METDEGNVATVAHAGSGRNRSRIVRGLRFTIELVMGLVLAFSGWAHIQNEYFFMSSLIQFDFLPQWLVVHVASFLPWFSIVLGISLILSTQPRAANICALMLFASFAALHLRAILLESNVSCGCFGTHFEEKAGQLGLTIAATLTGLAVTTLFMYPKTPRVGDAGTNES